MWVMTGLGSQIKREQSPPPLGFLLCCDVRGPSQCSHCRELCQIFPTMMNCTPWELGQIRFCLLQVVSVRHTVTATEKITITLLV